MQEVLRRHIGMRGFVVKDDTTITVTMISFDPDWNGSLELVPVEAVVSGGETLKLKYADITFDDESSDDDVVVIPPEEPIVEVVPVVEPPAKAMTVMDTQASAILDPNMYAQMKALSSDFFSSKAVPSAYQNALQVLMALQAGKEMGMQPIESIQSITIINGNLSVWGKAVPGRLRYHGWSLSFKDGGADGPNEREQYCEATIKKGDESYTEKMTFGEAVDSGYTKDNQGRLKPGWLKGMNRRLKLRYDVLDMLCKTYVPEVFGGTQGTAEVYQDVDTTEKPETIKDQIKAATGKLDTKAKVVVPPAK